MVIWGSPALLVILGIPFPNLRQDPLNLSLLFFAIWYSRFGAQYQPIYLIWPTTNFIWFAPQLIHESGWSRNGAGRQYSHKFGYGLMDAGQMVDLVRGRPLMTSQTFGDFWTLPFCHIKAGVLLQTSNIESQKWQPLSPSCVTSFMNSP